MTRLPAPEQWVLSTMDEMETAEMIETYMADSSGRRNIDCIRSWQPLVERFSRRFPAQRLSRSGIEGRRNGGDLIGAVDAEVGAFREVLTQQPIGVLVSAALPWALRVAEVDLHARIDLETIMLGHFGSLVPSQRTAQFFGQGDDGARNRVAHRLSSVSRERMPDPS